MGIAGILVAACPEESCHYQKGSSRAKNLVEFTNSILKEIGYTKERIFFETFVSNEPEKLVKAINYVNSNVKADSQELWCKKMSKNEWENIQKRDYLISLIKDIALKTPEKSVEVPEELQGFGTIEIVEDKCVFCNGCTWVCEDEAMVLENKLDLNRLFKIPEDSSAKNKVELAQILKSMMKKEPKNEILVPFGLKAVGTPTYDLIKCVACKKCVEICKHEVLSLKLEWNLKEILT